MNEIQIQREYKVVKSNEIIQKARYDLTIQELKTLAYIFSKIKPIDTEDKEYCFSIREYCQVSGIDYNNGGNYEYIKKTLKNLRDKSFWLTEPDGSEVLVGWLSKARINKGTGKIKVKLDEDIAKYVIGLFSNYTQYELLSTLPMRSAYSFRIYELLKSYSYSGRNPKITFDLEELKKKLMATNYDRFPDFRRKVLEIAVKEINIYTDLEVTWEPEKKGKKVIKLIFEVKQKDSWGQYMTFKRVSNQLDRQIKIEDFYNEK